MGGYSMARTARFIPLVGFFLLAGSGAMGQGIIFPERPEIREQPFCVQSVRVKLTITDGHGERTLTLKYAEVLKVEGGLKRYSYSLSTMRFSSRPPDLASVLIRLKSSVPIKTVYSPSHDVSVRRMDDYNATASWEGKGEFS